MSTLTRTIWIAPRTVTWAEPEIAVLVYNEDPLFKLLMQHTVVADGTFQQPWYSGSTADYVGASLTGTTSVGGLAVNKAPAMGEFIQVEEVSTSLTANSGFSSESQNKMARQQAIAGIMTALAAGVVGTDTGLSNGTLQGLEAIVTSYGLGHGNHVIGTASTYADLTANIDTAFAKTVRKGQKVLLASPEGVAALKARIRIEGYGPIEYLLKENFGFQYPLYDGAIVIETDALSDGRFMACKFGPGAIQFVIPTAGPFKVGPAIGAAGSTIVSRNLTMNCQLRISHRDAIVLLDSDITTS